MTTWSEGIAKRWRERKTTLARIREIQARGLNRNRSLMRNQNNDEFESSSVMKREQGFEGKRARFTPGIDEDSCRVRWATGHPNRTPPVQPRVVFPLARRIDRGRAALGRGKRTLGMGKRDSPRTREGCRVGGVEEKERAIFFFFFEPNRRMGRSS